MTLAKALHYCALVTFVLACILAVYLIKESKATSYLTDNSKTCINCHVMQSYYSSWQHSSHAQRATCVDCHLPTENYIDKYASKTRDGWNHSVAFTFNTYGQNLLISEDGSRRVQMNCKRCHAGFSRAIIKNVDRYHDFSSGNLGDRKCWDCHRTVPHGKVRGLNTTPYSLAVK